MCALIGVNLSLSLLFTTACYISIYLHACTNVVSVNLYVTCMCVSLSVRPSVPLSACVCVCVRMYASMHACYVLLCYVVLCYVMPNCYAMLC